MNIFNEVIYYIITIKKKVGIIVEDYFEVFNKSGEYIYTFYTNYSRQILDSLHSLFDSTFDILILFTIFLTLFYLIMSISLVFKKTLKLKSVPKGKEPKVTIQIPTYNELAAINCAKCCLDFDYPKEKMQIIIGDDSSDKNI